MASLLRRTGASGAVSPFWFAKYRGPDGQPIVKTTKQTERKKAQAIADAWELAAERARHGELTQAVILKGMGDLLERTTGERLNVVSTKDFFSDWLQSKTSIGRAGSTVERYKPIINGFIAFLSDIRARASVASITPTEIEKFRDAQLAVGKGKSTANLALQVLRAVFNAARRKGFTTNPAEAVELLNAEAEERHPFTEDQTRSLLTASKGTDWAGMILTAWHTGIRLHDCASLTWANIDLAQGTLSFREGKTAGRKKGKKETVVCLHPDLQSWLESLASHSKPNLPLFPTLHGKPSGSHGGLSNSFSRIMEKACIVQPSVPTVGTMRVGKGRQFRALGFHSFRHAFISRLANADVPADVRKSIAGHSSDEVHRRYTHLELDTQRRAISRLPGIGRF